MIIDMHAHIYPEKIADKAVNSICDFYSIPMYGRGTIPDLLEKGKAAGVSKFLVHSTATKPEQVNHINDFIMASCNTNEELIGFGTLHPGMTDSYDEVTRVIKGGLKGIKLHPDFQTFNIDDPDAYHLYEACENRIPILIHMGDYRYDYSRPDKLAKILELFPKLTVIAAHFGGWSRWQESFDVLAGKQLYMDTCSSLEFIDGQMVRKFVDKHGADKFFFGTDYPMWDIKKELEIFDSLPLTDNEKELILGRNACRFLNIKYQD